MGTSGENAKDGRSGTDSTLRRELVWMVAVVDAGAIFGALVYGASLVEWLAGLTLATAAAVLITTIAYWAKRTFRR